jgi:CRISPR-associated protein Cas5t
MRVIRFRVDGLLNSFRVPFFRSYHKSFLAPPKSTIIGMLCNISLKSQEEFFEILDSDSIGVSVVIDKIVGRGKDLWSYKTIATKNRGKSVIRRDKLFQASYYIYLSISDEVLYNDIFNSLKEPKSIPSLGLDDELVEISDVVSLDIQECSDNSIESVFLDKGVEYKVYIKDRSKPIEMPVAHISPLKFIAFDKNGKFISREVKKESAQVEFINCIIEFQDDIVSFKDVELEQNMVFY